MTILGSVARGAEYAFQWVSGDSLTLAPKGGVWLYHYSWGGLQRSKLGDIQKGKARIELNAKSLEENIKPPSNTEASVFTPFSWAVQELKERQKGADLEIAELKSHKHEMLLWWGALQCGPRYQRQSEQQGRLDLVIISAMLWPRHLRPFDLRLPGECR